MVGNNYYWRKLNFFSVLILPLVTAVLALLLFIPQAQALTLTPPMLEFGADPGTEVSSRLRIINESTQTVELYASTANFTAKDETGNPYFLFGEQGGLASWIQVPAGSITLLPGERQDIPFTIQVPQVAEAGGYYAGIFFGSPVSPSGGESNVGISSKLGSLIILRVAGDIKMQNEIKEFHILAEQTFFTNLPVNFWYRLHNSGNVHVRPYGTITIKHILGWTSAKVSANPIDGAVLPNSTRRLEAVWQRAEPSKIEYRNFLQYFLANARAQTKNFALGRYSATLTFTHPSDIKNSVTVVFWVFPWQLLCLGLIIVVVGGYLLIKGIKTYNRWVVKKYTKH